MKNEAQGLCIVCSAPVLLGANCPKHYAHQALNQRNRMRTKKGRLPSYRPVMFHQRTIDQLRAKGIEAVGITHDGTLVTPKLMVQWSRDTLSQEPLGIEPSIPGPQDGHRSARRR